MIPNVDRFGNYQSTLTDNGIWGLIGAGLIDFVAGNYSGGQPTFTPTAFAEGAFDTSNNNIWFYSNGVWTNVTGSGSQAPDAITYPGPPVVNPPALQNIVVDVNGRQWMYFNGGWN